MTTDVAALMRVKLAFVRELIQLKSMTLSLEHRLAELLDWNVSPVELLKRPNQ
jgi:hypothetical protein